MALMAKPAMAARIKTFFFMMLVVLVVLNLFLCSWLHNKVGLAALWLLLFYAMGCRSGGTSFFFIPAPPAPLAWQWGHGGMNFMLFLFGFVALLPVW